MIQKENGSINHVNMTRNMRLQQASNSLVTFNNLTRKETEQKLIVRVMSDLNCNPSCSSFSSQINILSQLSLQIF